MANFVLRGGHVQSMRAARGVSPALSPPFASLSSSLPRHSSLTLVFLRRRALREDALRRRDTAHPDAVRVERDVHDGRRGGGAWIYGGARRSRWNGSTLHGFDGSPKCFGVSRTPIKAMYRSGRPRSRSSICDRAASRPDAFRGARVFSSLTPVF